jgi:predicted CXXCH cytochrome family protein
MPSPGRKHAVATALAAALLALALGGGGRARAQPAPTPAFVGAKTCGECHARVAHRWTSGRHSKMAQPATEASVKGDFARGEITLRDERFRLRVQDGRYFIQDERVDFTLGNRRVQHYLTRRADGWIVVLAPTWDVVRREWFHNMEIVRPDEKHVNGVQVWNKNCDGCHVSQQRKNFDPATRSYATEWGDFGTSCERCHGPGALHAAGYRERAETGGPAPATAGILNPGKLDARRSTSICAQCHSLRDVVVAGYTAGAEYYDHFLPILEYGPRQQSDPAWWPDGRPRRFSNDALGLWQSRCFQKGGASCLHCHLDPHEPDVEANAQLRSDNRELCTQCHAEIGRDVSRHTHHPASSPGSSCVECHMPPTVFSIKAKIRDHTISVPEPENTLRFGIPNACGSCHADKKPQWAAAALERWGAGRRGRRLVEQAEAFSQGRARKPEAVAKLVAIAGLPDESPLIRANAVGYLATRFATEEARAAVLEALRSDEPLLRAVAALNIGGNGFPAERARPALVAALRDPRRVVRASAAFSLVGSGVARLPGEDGLRFEAAKADYVARARFHSDDADTQLDLGKFLLLAERFDEARDSFELARRLDAARPLDYFLALSDVGLGRTREARERLRRIPAGDPFAEAARKLLMRLPASP